MGDVNFHRLDTGGDLARGCRLLFHRSRNCRGNLAHLADCSADLAYCVHGIPGRAAYHASKHGVLGLTSSAALEYAPRGIRINAVCPGTIATPMVTDMIDKGELDRDAAIADQPINRLGEPEEIAAAVLWLCSPGASFVVGVALPIDGGYTAR